jgi:ubiquinone/menaquinone biosynthesis C-methylase UbiE
LIGVIEPPNRLRDEQYGDASRFGARVELHRRFSTNPEPWHSWMFDRLGLPPDARVLELGCGPALLWRGNADRIPSGWRIVLSDFSPGMLEAARRVLAPVNHGFELVVVDATEIPFDAQAFDGVIANHMLYHVPDRERALSEIRRVMTPGGRLYAATIGRRHLQELYELAGLPNRPPQAFGVENGGEQLEAVFDDVVFHEFHNALRVTEAEPALAYVESIAGPLENRDEVVRVITARISAHGAFELTSSTGLFECR